jgi:putative nucleotidyltransferase with HDIG domain
MTGRPTKTFVAMQIVGSVVALGVAVWLAPEANWDIPSLLILLTLAVASEANAVRSAAKGIKMSGSFLAIVVALVVLGATPGVLVGLLSIFAGWAIERYTLRTLILNVFTYAWFPLVAGAAFHASSTSLGVGNHDPLYYFLAFGAFGVALILDYAGIIGYYSYEERSSFWAKIGRTLLPVLPSELASAMISVVVVWAYVSVGAPALAFAAIGIFVFQYLLGAMLLSQQRADELEIRAKELAGFQVALLGALLRTLDLRDRMTARHSAAVARYSREIAAAAGLSEPEQEVAHTAGLLHDIGKFVLPDRILKSNARLSEEDWEQIRRHPYEGARIVSQVDGYRAIGDIIIAHHERPDGLGYPRGLEGDDIPLLARIVSVADAYDVLTARDSYREPCSSFEALAEMRRVAGTQLDERFVEVFADVLSHKDFAYRHGEDVDFEAELALDRRINDFVNAAIPKPGESSPADLQASPQTAAS